MAERQSLAKLPPLLFGRAVRVVLGVGTLYWTTAEGMDSLGEIGYAALIFLGISFLLGGVLGNPGCEITSLPNMVLPKDRQVHFL